MNSILEIPEIKALDGPSGLIRIPNQIDVPVTDRVLRLIDTPEFQRLTNISQLGVVSFVYPAAHHNRFEHSLGVYRMSLLFLRQMAHQAEFAEEVTSHDAMALIVAALFHDIGHWPFCHPIEDLCLDGVPQHEELANSYLNSDNVVKLLAEDWHLKPAAVVNLINQEYKTTSAKILGSILSGPIDIDKMDYLYRDSLHAGVPYGQNFDSPRLIRSLCLGRSGDQLAITEKGKTAAELMVFARYVMFSEVYWHHAVRSATAMFQRAFYLWYQQHHQVDNFDIVIERLFRLGEREMIDSLRADCNSVNGRHLLNSLFGPQRNLFKRIANFSCFDGETIYRAIAQRPYAWTVRCSQFLADLIGKQIDQDIDSHQVLIDAPPVGLEVQFNVDVFFNKESRYRELGSVSPVVQTLAHKQFDDFVKQVRIFVDPDIQPRIQRLSISSLLEEAIQRASQ